jgi:hypothetical protein
MRKDLRDWSGRRHRRFQAVFERYGCRKCTRDGRLEFALFVQVRDESGQIATDHLWLEMDGRFHGLDLRPGDEVFLCAKVVKYRRRNPEAASDPDAPPTVADYTLGEVTKISAFAAPRHAAKAEGAGA